VRWRRTSRDRRAADAVDPHAGLRSKRTAVEHRRLAGAGRTDKRNRWRARRARTIERRRVGARRIVEGNGMNATVPRPGEGIGTGSAGARIAGSTASSSNSRSWRPPALQIADDF
jgi:hypothetical protein